MQQNQMPMWKQVKQQGKMLCLLLTSLVLMPNIVFAAESEGILYRAMSHIGFTNPVTTIIFRFVNLFIVLFVLHKYARPAILQYLRSAAKSKKEEFSLLQDELNEVQEQTSKVTKELADLAKESEEAKNRIQQEATRACEELKKEANKQVDYWKNAMEQRLESKLSLARTELKRSMTQEAIKLVYQKVEQDDKQVKEKVTKQSITQLHSI